MNKIILCNIRSVLNKKTDLEYLTYKEQPDLIGFCETWLKEKDNFDLKDYGIIRKDRKEQIGGGLAFCIKKELQYKPINLRDRFIKKIEVLGIKINYRNKWLNILLFYNPCNNISREILEYYIDQIDEPKLIMGDFNAHHAYWNPNLNQRLTNITGKNIFDFISQNNLILLTPPGQTTRVDPNNGKGSTIDLILASPTLSHLEVETGYNVGSDHLPIIIKDNLPKKTQSKEKKWKFIEEGWKKYQKEIERKDIENIKTFEELTNLLHNIGTKYFLFKNDYGINKPNKPWWNSVCNDVIKQRNRAYNKWRKRPSQENLFNYKKQLAIARQTINKEKRKSWENFCNTIDFKTSSKKVWNFIKSFTGKKSIIEYPIIHNDTPISDTTSKLNLFKEEFKKTIKKKPKLLLTKNEREALLNLPDTEELSNKITIEEVKNAIANAKNKKAYGPDEITYEFYKQAPMNLTQNIQRIINDYWSKGQYPKEQKNALVNPILKLNKNPKDTESYRFISRTSCLGKIFENIINRRIVWWLEKHNKLNKDQIGFRPNQSTIDALQVIDLHINKARREKKYTLIACIDFEKAFDSANQEAILIKAAKMGITGLPLRFINNFLKDRTFQIIIGDSKTEKEKNIRGVPQGSPLSPTLFNILMSDLEVTEEVHKIIYADDVTLITSSKDIEEAINKLKVGLKKVSEWTDKWDLKMNLSKSKIMCFTNKKIRQIPNIEIDNRELIFSTNNSILGLIFDAPKLTWKKHIENLKVKVLNRINIMKKLSTTSWGANRETMIAFYNIYIKPQVEYGLTVYGVNKSGDMKKLQTLQNEAMRIATGCFRSTPIILLEAFTNIASIKKQIKETECIQLIKTLNKQNDMPIKKLITKEILEYKLNKDRKSFIHRVLETMKELKINININITPNISPLPPWYDISKYIETNFMDGFTKNMPDQVIQNHFHMIENTKYRNHKKIFTDGSKIQCPNSTSAAVYVKDYNLTTIWTLPSATEILEAELYAIKQGLTYIHNNKIKETVIFTDSKSALLLLQNQKPKTNKHLIYEIQTLIKTLTIQNHKIILHWIPAHKGIKGNEIADLAAKKAHNTMNPMNIPHDTGNIIKEIKTSSQKNWENDLNNILTTKDYLIKNNQPQPWTRSKNRKLDVCLTRILTKHTRLKQHLHRLKLENDPTCRWCRQEEETTEHLILQCPRFNSYRTYLLDALRKAKINNPNINLLITGSDLPPTKRYYILRHMKIFLQRTKITDYI